MRGLVSPRLVWDFTFPQAKDFVGEIDYRMLIETIWQQFPEMNIPLRTERALLDPAHQLDPSLPIRSNITELDPTVCMCFFTLCWLGHQSLLLSYLPLG
jgi:hypothetical protein